jgi:general stress protein YciG
MAKRKTSETGRRGGMTVAEAGRKGGETVRDTRGHEFYEEIGRKGGRKVRDLIAAGRRALDRK